MDAYHPTQVRGVTPVKAQRARELRQDMTAEERILWRELRLFRTRGFTFRRQQIIAGFIVDFYCYAARLVIEVDGGIHAQQTDYDAERDIIIAAHGLRILRVTNEEVRRNLAGVTGHIGAACVSGSSPLTAQGFSCPNPFPSQGEGE